MPLRVPSLQLPLAQSEPALKTNRQLTIWATQVVSVINSLGANPGLMASGNPGSAVTTLSFSGAAGTIDMSALMHFVSGGESLATVKAPQGFTGPFFMIAANEFSLTSGGNIITPAGDVQLRQNEMVPMVFDGNNWYVSVPISSNLLNVKIITYADSPYTVSAEDEVVIASAGANADTVVNLPAATGSGRPLDVKKVNANPNSIAVTPAGTDTVDDASGPFEILAQYGAYTMLDYSVGKWAII